MRKTTNAWVKGMAGWVILTSAACAAPPTESVEQATADFAAAEEAGAVTYAPEEYRTAQDAKLALEAELAVQNQKMVLFRSYDTVASLATAAQEAAQTAEEAGRAGKERVRVETVRLIADARVAVEEARQALEVAPTGKGTELDLAAMKADLDVVVASLVDAEAVLQQDGFEAARIKAESALRAAQQVTSAVEVARAQQGRRPRA